MATERMPNHTRLHPYAHGNYAQPEPHDTRAQMHMHMHMHMFTRAHTHMRSMHMRSMHARLALQQRPEKVVDGALAQPVLDLDATRGLADTVHAVLRLQH